MSQTNKTKQFTELHVKGSPVVLCNAWDGGEEIPIEFLFNIVGRIAATVSLPVTVDFEGGYSDKDSEIAKNLTRLLDLGIAGINFEDRVVKGSGLYTIEEQARRMSVLRRTAREKGVDLFINARTDLFLGQGNEPKDVVSEAIRRGKAYAAAGASGFFIPGLDDARLIRKICESVDMPVNVMMMDGCPSVEDLAKLGVSRISWGPASFFDAMEGIKRTAIEIAIPVSGLGAMQ